MALNRIVLLFLLIAVQFTSFGKISELDNDFIVSDLLLTLANKLDLLVKNDKTEKIIDEYNRFKNDQNKNFKNIISNLTLYSDDLSLEDGNPSVINDIKKITHSASAIMLEESFLNKLKTISKTSSGGNFSNSDKLFFKIGSKDSKTDLKIDNSIINNDIPLNIINLQKELMKYCDLDFALNFYGFNFKLDDTVKKNTNIIFDKDLSDNNFVSFCDIPNENPITFIKNKNRSNSAKINDFILLNDFDSINIPVKENIIIPSTSLIGGNRQFSDTNIYLLCGKKSIHIMKLNNNKICFSVITYKDTSIFNMSFKLKENYDESVIFPLDIKDNKIISYILDLNDKKTYEILNKILFQRAQPKIKPILKTDNKNVESMYSLIDLSPLEEYFQSNRGLDDWNKSIRRIFFDNIETNEKIIEFNINKNKNTLITNLFSKYKDNILNIDIDFSNAVKKINISSKIYYKDELQKIVYHYNIFDSNLLNKEFEREKDIFHSICQDNLNSIFNDISIPDQGMRDINMFYRLTIPLKNIESNLYNISEHDLNKLIYSLLENSYKDIIPFSEWKDNSAQNNMEELFMKRKWDFRYYKAITKYIKLLTKTLNEKNKQKQIEYISELIKNPFFMKITFSTFLKITDIYNYREIDSKIWSKGLLDWSFKKTF